MKATFSPLRLDYAAADNPHVDGDQYSTDVELDGAPQDLIVTVSGHASHAIGRDEQTREARLAAIVGQMIAEALPIVPARMSIGVDEIDMVASTPEMADGVYLVPSL